MYVRVGRDRQEAAREWHMNVPTGRYRVYDVAWRSVKGGEMDVRGVRKVIGTAATGWHLPLDPREAGGAVGRFAGEEEKSEVRYQVR